MVLNGIEFKAKHNGAIFYKYMSWNNTKDNTYQQGCVGFYEQSKLPLFLQYHSGAKCCEVEILDESFICESNTPHQFVTNKLLLKSAIYIEDLEYWNDENFCTLAVSYKPHALQYTKNQTNEMCEFAVFKDGHVLKYVKNQTEKICKLAVQQDGSTLQYVENQTDELCKLAVQQDGSALQYVKNQTDELCKLAVQQDGYALQYVENQTDEICELAVQKSGSCIKYVNNKTDKLCKMAVEKCPIYLECIN